MKKQYFLILCILIIRCYSLPLDKIKVQSNPDDSSIILPSAVRDENSNEDEFNYLSDFETTTESKLRIANDKRLTNFYLDLIAKIRQLRYDDSDGKVENIVEKSITGSEFTTESYFPSITNTNPSNGIRRIPVDYNDNEARTLPYFSKVIRSRDYLRNNDWSTGNRDKAMCDKWDCTERVLQSKDDKTERGRYKEATIPYNEKGLPNDAIEYIPYDKSKTKRESFADHEPYPSKIDLLGLDNLMGEEPHLMSRWDAGNPLPFESDEAEAVFKNKNSPSPYSFEQMHSQSKESSEMQSLSPTDIKESIPSLTSKADKKEAKVSNIMTIKKSPDLHKFDQLLETGFKNIEASSEQVSRKNFPLDDTTPVNSTPMAEIKIPEISVRPILNESAVSDSKVEVNSVPTTEIKNSKVSEEPVLVKNAKDMQQSLLLNSEETDSSQQSRIENFNSSAVSPLSMSLLEDNTNFHLLPASLENIEPINTPKPNNFNILYTPRTIDLGKLGIEMQPKSWNTKTNLNSESTSLEDSMQAVPPKHFKVIQTPRTINFNDLGSEAQPNNTNNLNPNDFNLQPSSYFGKKEQSNFEQGRAKDAFLRKDLSTVEPPAPTSTQRTNGKRSTTESIYEEQLLEQYDHEKEMAWERMEGVKVESADSMEDDKEDEDDNESSDKSGEDSSDSAEDEDETGGYDLTSFLAKGISNLLTFYLYVRRTTVGLSGFVNRILG